MIDKEASVPKSKQNGATNGNDDVEMEE